MTDELPIDVDESACHNMCLFTDADCDSECYYYADGANAFES